WKQQLGTVQKAPPVLADGKIYVGTETGKFFILKPHNDRCEVLSEVEMPESKESAGGSQGTPEQILAGAAISRGRVFFVSSDALYAIGSKRATAPTGFAVDDPVEKGEGSPAWVQVTPTELVLKPGQAVKLHARLYDDKGRFLREEKAEWSLAGLKGAVSDGTLTVGNDASFQGGTIKATVGGISGEARARVIPNLPISESFESYAVNSSPPGWVNAIAGKFVVTELDGHKVLQKPPDETLFKRIRMFFGPVEWHDYTYEGDVRVNMRRRQMGDIGLTAQRYSLVLYGNTQKLKIEPWEPEIERSVTVPFEWVQDKWYHLKLRVENLPDGSVRARGKAWATGDPEPANWMIEKVDKIGHRQGSPGVFLDAQFGAYLDNLKVTAN
ncbi:MAG TPA: PQQ-binding-like beta-propeller repeat protein, partial [Bryobacteraceae bacterium]|nr:PQQ-binding-like beta-propeller repeat protein [Bryobacteraceae bacterium]